MTPKTKTGTWKTSHHAVAATASALLTVLFIVFGGASAQAQSRCTPSLGLTNSDNSPFGHRGGTRQIQYIGSCLPSSTPVSSSVSWLNINFTRKDPAGGDNVKITIRYNASALSENISRSGQIQIKIGNSVTFFTVKQQVIPENCAASSYSVSSAGTFSEAGGARQVAVETPFYCKWSVKHSQAWSSSQNSIGRVGSGQFTLRVAENPDFRDRAGSIQIFNDNVTVPAGFTQGAKCQVTATLSSSNFSAEGGSGNVIITANKSTCGWSVTKVPSWVVLRAAATGAGTTTVRFDVARNNDLNSRSETLCVGGSCVSIRQDPNQSATCTRGPLTALAGRDLGLIRRAVSGSRPSNEVYFLSAASRYGVPAAMNCTDFTVGDRSWAYLLVDWNGDKIADLAGIRLSGTASGRPEIIIRSGANGFGGLNLASSVLPISSINGSEQFLFADHNGDGRPDLHMIRRLGTPSGKVEITVLSGADDLKTALFSTVTGQQSGNPDVEFVAIYRDIDMFPDLLMVTKRGTGSGSTEVAVLGGASRYAATAETMVTGLPQTNSTWEFEATDWDGDEKADLLAVQKRFTNSGRVEVQILSGASRFSQSLGTLVTALSPVDDNVEFSMPDLPLTNPRRRNSFDTDSFNDLAVWRPEIAAWFVLPTSGSVVPNYEASFTTVDTHRYYLRYFGLPASLSRQAGIPVDVPVPGDYDGDTIRDIAVWRPREGNWYILPSSGKLPWKAKRYQLNDGTVYYSVQLGLEGDTPVAGYYDGDGIADLAVWRGTTGQWFVLPSTGRFALAQSSGLVTTDGNTYFFRNFGVPGSTPAAADYDGDRITDLGVWHSGSATWSVLPTTASVPAGFSQGRTADGQVFYSLANIGSVGDIPIAGQYDGDGKADIAFWRPSTSEIQVLTSSQVNLPWSERVDGIANSSLRLSVRTFGPGLAIPVPADYDGDGLWDPAVWDQPTGNWHILATNRQIPLATRNVRTLANGYIEYILQLGLPGDIPVGRTIGN